MRAAMTPQNHNTISFTTPALPVGSNMVSIQESHPVSKQSSPTVDVIVVISSNTPTVITNNVVTVTQTTAMIPFSLADVDGIKNYTCQAYLGDAPVGSVITPNGPVCTITDLKAKT